MRFGFHPMLEKFRLFIQKAPQKVFAGLKTVMLSEMISMSV